MWNCYYASFAALMINLQSRNACDLLLHDCVLILTVLCLSLYPWQINCTLLIWFITFHVTLSHELQIQHEKYIVLYFLYILMKIKSIFLPNSHYCNAKKWHSHAKNNLSIYTKIYKYTSVYFFCYLSYRNIEM